MVVPNPLYLDSLLILDFRCNSRHSSSSFKHHDAEYIRLSVYPNAHDQDLPRRNRRHRICQEFRIRELLGIRHHIRLRYWLSSSSQTPLTNARHRPILVFPYNTQQRRRSSQRFNLQQLDRHSRQRRLTRSHRHPRLRYRTPHRHHALQVQHVDRQRK